MIAVTPGELAVLGVQLPVEERASRRTRHVAEHACGYTVPDKRSDQD